MSVTFDTFSNESVASTSRSQPWLVVFTAALFFFYEFLQLNMFNAVDPALMREFHITAAKLGLLSANYFYANLVFLFAAGIILDRVSTRKIILIAMIVSVICTIVFALADSFFVASVCRFGTGLAGSFCLLSCIRLTANWFPPRRMALVIGLIVTMAMIGGMVAQTPMTLLTDTFGWRKTLLMDAGLGFIMLIAIALIVRDHPPGTNNVHHQHMHLSNMGFWRSLAHTIMNKQNWLAGFYTSFMNLPIFLLGAMWGGMFFVQIHGLSRVESSYITSMIFVGTIVGAPVVGWFSDRICRRKMPMIICGFISLAIILFIMYLPTITVFNGMLLLFLLGFFTSAQIISYPLIAESNPNFLTATAEGLASTLIMAGGISQQFFGWLMGLHWQHTYQNGVPFYSVSDYRLALAIMPIAFILALLAAFLTRETHCKGYN